MKTYINLFALALIALLAASCGSEELETKADLKLPTAKVKLAEVSSEATANSHTFSARVKADKQVKLGTRLMGQITMLSVEEGDKVTAGQTLIRIKSGDIEASRAQIKANQIEAEAALENAKRDYERMKTLVEKESATQKELDDMKTRYEMAKAKIEAIKEMKKGVSANLDYAVITAPFSGYVVQKMANKGDLASPGQPILVIEAPNDFEVVAKVPENEITLFAEGDPVKINVEALPEATFTGKVGRVTPTNAGQYEVKIALTGSPEMKALRSGMYARVILQKGKSDQILVPQEAIVKRGQLEGIFAVNQQNEAMLRWIRTGETVGGKVEVLSGLSEGEKYVVAAEGKLQDGQPVSE